MSKQYLVNKIFRKFFAAVSLVALAGCLPSDDNYDHNITGSVGDGPIISADISIVGADGADLATLVGSPTADFAVTIQTNDGHYPLLVSATNGIDLVTMEAPDFAMQSAVLSPGDRSVANINPFTTFAVAIARELPGGVNDANVRAALNVVSDSLNNGLDTMTGAAVMDVEVDGSNIAEVVRASEALGEIVRRTRDTLLGAGYVATGDTVVSAIASDLIDGKLDGRGGELTDSRIAAVFALAQAQVSVETMRNELRVQGSDALGRLESATEQVLGAAPSRDFNELSVTAEMLDAARRGVAAAQALQPAAELTTLLDELDNVTIGMSSADVRANLTSDGRTALDSTLVTVSQGTDEQIEQVNEVAGSDTEQPAPNSGTSNAAPQISGQPALTVISGSPYSFLPAAADADGDVLTFSISGKPSWASFDGNSGRLYGTPQTVDVVVHTGISISVSDGQSVATLGPFSITVNSVSEENPPPVSNSAPVISGQPASSVLEGTPYSFLPAVTDADGDPLSFVVTRKPSWASFDNATGRLYGTPGAADVGDFHGINITVSDGQAIDSLGAFSISVNAVAPPPVINSAPVISGQPILAVVSGTSYDFRPTATDEDGDALTFSVSGKPSWASFDASTGRLYGTPDAGDVGAYSDINISVSDGQASDALAPFSVSVDAIALGSVTLNWTLPTQNTDGTPLTDLAAIGLYWGREEGNYTESVTINNPGITTYVVENLEPGTWYFVSTAFNDDGIESEYSGSISRVIE